MADNIVIGVGLSTEQDGLKAIKEAMQQARATVFKETINMAFVFSSIEFAHTNVIKTISILLGENIPIVGCSAAAIISNKGIFRKGLIILLISFPKTIRFNTAIVKDINKKGPQQAGEELSEKLLRGFSGTHRDLGVIFSDGLIEESSNLIYGLQERLGTSFPLIGALASDNLQFLKTFVYYNQEIAANAACGIIWGGKLNFGWGIKHGWKPLGKPRRITKAKANIVYEIDNLPAAKVYEEYLASNANEIMKELKRISIFYPIGIHLEGEEEYLLRNVHSIGNDGSLTLQGNIPEESLMRLMIGTKESCLTATRQALREVKIGLYGKKVAFAFVFNSISRYILLGRDAKKELAVIQEELGKDTPLIGIYTYGEQAPLRAINYHGKTYLHNQTFTILAVGE